MQDLFQTGIESQSGSSDVQRSEIVPKFISTIHKVPKQLVDTVQMVGVSEQFMSLKLNSGVLLASQVAHDKWLARLDGILDAFWIFVVLLLFVLTGPNYVVLTMIVLGMWYWYYHIMWYAKAKQWETSITGTEYLKDTIKGFWISAFSASAVLYLGVATFVMSNWAFAAQKVVAYIIHYIVKASNLFSSIFVKGESFFSSNESSDSSEYTTEQLKNLIYSDLDIEKKTVAFADSIQSYAALDVSVWVLSEEQVLQTLDKYSAFNDFYLFTTYEYGKEVVLVLSIGLLYLFTFISKKVFEKHYMGKKDLIDQDASLQMKYDIENKMEELARRV